MTQSTAEQSELTLLTVQLRFEHDIVLARQRARQTAELLTFDSQVQTRIATAVSELARNAFEYAGGGKVEFQLIGHPFSLFQITVSDKGPGIADPQTIFDGTYVSKSGMGLGIVGAKRLMDRFSLESAAGGGTVVRIGQMLARNAKPFTPERLAEIAASLSSRAPQSPFEEIQRQNQELVRALNDLSNRQADVERLNSELAETNRGVMALYAELDDRAEQLRVASEMKSKFLSHMSHELRTPLSAIVSLSDILLSCMDGELTLEQEKQISYIGNSARELIEIVSDLLDIAKIEAGRLAVAPAWFEVSALYGSLRGMFRALKQSADVALIFEEHADLPSLYSDERKVAQILRNFISNALKFTSVGEVRVSAHVAEDERMIFSVRDTGIGIPPDQHEQVFEEFVQVDSAIQKRVRGTGLGLPLCMRLARLLGGSISMTSEPGVGSEFMIHLPRRYQGDPDSSCAPMLATGNVDE
jgi:signal transduction histidine kinase